MDGLSGIKIYQQIKVDTAYLPTEYPTALKFLIKGLSNKVDSSGWTTSIETVSVPVIDFVNGGENSSTGGGTGNSNTINLPPSPANRGESRNNVNATNLRNTISQLGYREKGKEIDSSGIDITAAISKAASDVLKLIKQELPTVKVTVTGGNDYYHQYDPRVNYPSRHKSGNAADFTVSPSDRKTLDKIVVILKKYQATNPKFSYIDEYANQTQAATGNHFHLQI